MGEAISLEKKLYEFLGKEREKTEAEKLMEEHFSYVYPYEKSTHRSPKYSVSLLKMKAMEEHGERLGEQLGSEIGQEGRAVAPEWDEEKIDKVEEIAEGPESLKHGTKDKGESNTEIRQQVNEKPDSPLIQKMKAEGKIMGAAVGTAITML